MDNNVARDLLRHAMAYREKAHAAVLTGEAPGAERALDEAQAYVQRIRVAVMAELEVRGAELRAAIENPYAGADVTLLRGNVAAFNALLRAQRADQLGAFVDLPLDGYPARIRARGEALGIWPSRRAPRQHRQYTIAGMDVMPTRRGFVVWLICLIGALLVSGLYLGVLRPFSEIGLSASPVDAQGNVHVTCRNERMRTVTLFVPGTPAAPLPQSASNYAIQVYTREKSGGHDRLLPPVPTAWAYLGVALQEAMPITLGPSLACELTFSPARVRDVTGASFTGLRIVLARASGTAAASWDVDMPPAAGK